MWKEKFDALAAEVLADESANPRARLLAGASLDSVAEQINAPASPAAISPDLPPSQRFEGWGGEAELAFTDRVVRRALVELRELLGKDPKLLAIIGARPELRVTVKRETIEADGKTVRGRLGYLIAHKFFDAPRPAADILAEFRRRGWAADKGRPIAITGPQGLGWLVENGFLTKEETGYQAVHSMKVSITETK